MSLSTSSVAPSASPPPIAEAPCASRIVSAASPSSAPVSSRWDAGGLTAVAAYWRAFFAAEPCAKVEVHESADAVTLELKVCPAIQHLRAHGREIVPCFCQHCYFISEAMAAPAGF